MLNLHMYFFETLTEEINVTTHPPNVYSYCESNIKQEITGNTLHQEWNFLGQAGVWSRDCVEKIGKYFYRAAISAKSTKFPSILYTTTGPTIEHNHFYAFVY